MSGWIVPAVTGPTEVADEAIVLPHEHLLIDYGVLTGEPRTAVDADVRADLVRRLSAARRAGVGVIVDCTPPGYGRYLDVMAEVGAAAGVAIVAATGSFCEAWAPLPWWVPLSSTEQLATAFVRELTEGAGDTTWRAGIIKTATGEVASATEQRVLTAAGRAQRATGSPIVAHTTGGLGLLHLDRYAAEGADLSRVLVSHVGFEEDPVAYACAIAERGAYVGFDRIGHHHFFADEHWVNLTVALLEAGHGDRVLLSHDAVTRFSGPAAIGAHTFSDYTYVPQVFLPALRAAGVDPATISRLVRDNPRAWLAGEQGATHP